MSKASKENEKGAKGKEETPVIFIESPYSGDIERNCRYLNICVAEAMLLYGECPYASHSFMTQHARHPQFYVSDFDKQWNIMTREQAIECSQAMRRRCDRTVFYTDLGWSRGMRAALAYCKEHNLPWEERCINVEETAAKSTETGGLGYPADFIRALISGKQCYKKFMLKVDQ